ncbi:MAG: hypothetical protein AAF846_16580 [Chloroflexota bacterium]
MTEKKKKNDQNQAIRRDACMMMDACLHTDLTGCFDGRDGGCLDLDFGRCFNFDGGCSMLFLLPLRWLVIVGLMLYGDWDYQHHRAKNSNP